MDAGVPCSGQHSRGDQLLFHLLHLLPVLAWFPSHFTADVAHLEASKWGSSDVLVTCFYVKDKRRKEKQDIVGDNNGFLSSSPWMSGMMETGFSDSRRCNLSHRNRGEKFKREQLSIVVFTNVSNLIRTPEFQIQAGHDLTTRIQVTMRKQCEYSNFQKHQKNVLRPLLHPNERLLIPLCTILPRSLAPFDRLRNTISYIMTYVNWTTET